jgi:methylmalonyl-CoA mutase
MNNLLNDFPKISKESWIELLKKELKGADIQDVLIKINAIEGITYPSFFHEEDVHKEEAFPGVFPYKRSFFNELNDWSIVGTVSGDSAKNANQKALDLLMKGNTALYFSLSDSLVQELDVLFAGIEFQYIKAFFNCDSTLQIHAVKSYFEKHASQELFIAYNPLSTKEQLDSQDLIEAPEKTILRSFEVDAYSIQQAGANCAQEIAFALQLGHSYLHQQIQLGRTVDDALLNIHFTFGVGSNYLFEIAKLRSFRLLWAKIARSYSPQHRCNETAQITSKIGFLNKSLNDPYTNLLRQTTEVMSAVLGCANHIINQAYDAQSTSGRSELAERMATNISLILKEESYLEKVIDAVGGSYAIENLTENLADQAWSLFQETEAAGTMDSLIEKIKQTAKKRIEIYQEKKKTLIGITKFPNPDASNLTWKENNSSYFGLKELIIEKEIN